LQRFRLAIFQGKIEDGVNFTHEHLEECETPTIGILLCTDKNDAVVRYTLPDK
jgi:uncharacterized protein YeaC (DUF1315 family)